MPVLTGVGAFGAFYGAARLARHIPLLDQAIGGILRYADEGSTALVLLTACTNGVAEELFFRGAPGPPWRTRALSPRPRSPMPR